MGLFRWLKGQTGSTNGSSAALSSWHQDWRAACAEPSTEKARSLEAALDSLGLSEDDAEIEREMLEGLEHLVALRGSVAAGALPVVETGHRVVGTDTCHFTAPSSMPDEPSQPGGRLLLTGARAIFVGGAKALTVPWHAVVEVLDQDRDVVLVRHDRATLYRFRCNVYADALTAAYLARHLARRQRRAGGSV
jgi:hypothetical protein